MGNCMKESPKSPSNKTLTSQLNKRPLNDLIECLTVLNEDYPECTSVNYSQFEDIFSSILDDTEPFFLELQNEQDINGTVDVYEAFAAFTILSQAKIERKVAFLFKLFDFSKNGALLLPELVMTMQAAARGLCKFIHINPPSLKSLEQEAIDLFALIDNDGNKQIGYTEFVYWLNKNAELQEFLLRHVGIQTFENLKSRFSSIYSQFLFFFLLAAGGTEDHFAKEDALIEVIKREGHSLINEEDLNLLIGILRNLSIKMYGDVSPSDGTKKLIAKKAYESVVKAWSAFSASDFNNDDSLALHELHALLWLYEGKEPSATRAEYEMREMDKDGSQGISRYEWIKNLGFIDSEEVALYSTSLKKIFDQYDADNSGYLTIDEILEVVKEPLSFYLKAVLQKISQELVDGMINTLAKEIFDELDVNKDKKISWEEFKAYIKVSPGKFNKLKKFLNDNLS